MVTSELEHSEEDICRGHPDISCQPNWMRAAFTRDSTSEGSGSLSYTKRARAQQAVRALTGWRQGLHGNEASSSHARLVTYREHQIRKLIIKGSRRKFMKDNFLILEIGDRNKKRRLARKL